jgi:hypothetical protein
MVFGNKGLSSMKTFTVITVPATSGKVLGTIQAETSHSAWKKAERIEASAGPCAWRGEYWTLVEYNSPFSKAHKSKRMVKKWNRKLRRRVENQFSEEDWEGDTKKIATGGWKCRARNGTLVFD